MGHACGRAPHACAIMATRDGSINTCTHGPAQHWLLPCEATPLGCSPGASDRLPCPSQKVAATRFQTMEGGEEESAHAQVDRQHGASS